MRLFTVENMLVWNVLPPCMATIWAIVFVGDGEPADGGCAGCRSRRWSSPSWCRKAAAGKPLAPRICRPRAPRWTASCPDVVGNMAIVKAFDGISRENRRFEVTVGREMAARQQSLRYLECLRIAPCALSR